MIDFGSSCFTTDHLSSYVQSRSYRAPEVILGMSYGAKIDLWSLGAIIAELYTGEVRPAPPQDRTAHRHKQQTLGDDDSPSQSRPHPTPSSMRPHHVVAGTVSERLGGGDAGAHHRHRRPIPSGHARARTPRAQVRHIAEIAPRLHARQCARRHATVAISTFLIWQVLRIAFALGRPRPLGPRLSAQAEGDLAPPPAAH